MALEPVQWSDEFLVGIDSIDQQHLRLIEIINDLLANINDYSNFHVILNSLTRYSIDHLDFEESLMREHNLIDKDHLGEHFAFREHVADTCVDAAYNIASTKQTAEFMKNWWTNHICRRDKKSLAPIAAKTK